MIVSFCLPATPTLLRKSRREEKAEDRRTEKRAKAAFSVFFIFFKVDTSVSLPIN